MGRSKKYCEYILDFLVKLGRAIQDAWKVILFTLAGNFFPIYVGGFFLHFMKKDFHIKEILTPEAYIVYCATFLATATFLWHKNQKTKSYLSLLSFIMLFVFITICYMLTKLEWIWDRAFFEQVCEYLFGGILALYVISELANSYYVVNANYEEDRDRDYDRLKADFKSKKID